MVLTTFLSAVLQILDMLINAYVWVIIIGTIIFLVQPPLPAPIFQLFDRLTTPVYNKVRKIIPTIYGNIDCAPLIVIVILKFIDLFLLRLAFESLYTAF